MIIKLLHFIIALLIVVALAYYIKGERGSSFSRSEILPPLLVQPASCWIRPDSNFLLVGIWGREDLKNKKGA